eukprot:NODE_291_length_10603_cov_1.029703.p5 type:complete len:334 gc:universal NODE_291_length_10603_cov_1.029703:4242-3241(-)
MHSWQTLLTIFAITCSPIANNHMEHQDILYNRADCNLNLKDCYYITREQVLHSQDIKQKTTNYTFVIPNDNHGIVFNAIDRNIERLVASILFLRVKKCTLPISVIYNEMDAKLLKVLRFLPNTNVIQANTTLQGIFLVDYREILWINEPIFFLSDPSVLSGNLFWSSLDKYPGNDKIWEIYSLKCLNEFRPNSKIAHFNKSVIQNMTSFSELDVPMQVYLHMLKNKIDYKFEEFPKFLGSHSCQHSLLYEHEKSNMFIDMRNFDISSVVRYTNSQCNSYISARFDNCFKFAEYGLNTQRALSDISKSLEEDISSIKDAIEMSSHFIHLEPYAT